MTRERLLRLGVGCVGGLAVLTIALAHGADLDGVARAIQAPFRPRRLAALLLVLGAVMVGWSAVRSRFDPTLSVRAEGRARFLSAWMTPELILPLVVALSAACRIAIDTTIVGPRILGDELIYSGLAKSLANGDGFDVRGVHDIGHSTLFPALLALVYRATDSGFAAFGVMTQANAIAASLAALPVYFLARRALTERYALAISALSVLPVFSSYSGFAMTESVAYPLLMVFALQLVRTLENPAPVRQLTTLAVVALCVAARPQGLVLVAVICTAAILPARDPLRHRLRQFVPTWATLGVAAVAVALSGIAGRSLPGGSSGDLATRYDVSDLARWAIFHVAVVDLALGFVVFALLPAAWLWGLGSNSARVNAVTRVTVALSMWIFASVVVLAASPYGLDRLHERSMFYIYPLLVICSVAFVVARPGGSHRLVGAGLIVAVLAPALLPSRLIYASHDARTMYGWAEARETLQHLGPTQIFMSLAALLTCVLFLRLRASATFALAAAAVALCVAGATAVPLREKDSADARRFSWVDKAVQRSSDPLLLYIGVPGRGCPAGLGEDRVFDLTLATEFYSASVRNVAAIDYRGAGDLAAPEAAVAADGRVRVDGHDIVNTYVIADSRFPLAGRQVAHLKASDLDLLWHTRARGSLTLWRVDRPVRFVDVDSVRSRAERARSYCK